MSQTTVQLIKDNVVVNADINSSAAIAGSKVAPDFGSQNVAMTGTISDSKGDLRKLSVNAQSGDYTLVATDAGKFIRRTGGNVTIPDDIFATGDMVTILNDASTDMTIIAGSGFSLLNTADAASGNRTLAGRGMVTILFNSTAQGYISGAGLS